MRMGGEKKKGGRERERVSESEINRQLISQTVQRRVLEVE
jgi:hypothetical protein